MSVVVGGCGLHILSVLKSESSVSPPDDVFILMYCICVVLCRLINVHFHYDKTNVNSFPK